MTTNQQIRDSQAQCAGWSRQVLGLMALGLALLWVQPTAQAQETVCARVKIEIKQELTLERQAFDAEMNINNTTDSGVIENVSVVVKVTDEAGNPVAVSDNPNDTTAKFFIRVSSKQSISDITGTGTVSPKTTAIIDWLLIPAPGSAGTSPLGKKYLVGATLQYRFGNESQSLDVAPDVITVKPLPLLTLDYFLEQNVWADDPLTPEIEPVVPFTLGVRVKNNGYATAKNLKIDSAQPKIVENNQGLLINFTLTGSYVNDAPTQNTLLINFGDIAPNTSKMGRWTMETTLAGKFTEFSARFTHADELGGSLTSILQAANAHFLIHDVRVDLPGRDMVKDFLAQDGDVVRVYESDSTDTLVTDRSTVAQLAVGNSSNANASYHLAFPATSGFVYVKLPDPFSGQKALGVIKRSDAKTLLADNAWLSKTRNEQTKQWQYWVNFFDVNTTGEYDTEFQAPSSAPRPPLLQFIPDRTTQEGKQVSFLVEASSPDAKPVSISAAPLPSGATLTAQAVDPISPTVARAVFDWTPPKGAAGNYLINYTVSDGLLTGSRAASIKVESGALPPGPGTPEISSPASGGQVTTLKPTLSVLASANAQDTSTKIQFELYKDEAMTQLVDSALLDKAPLVAGNGGGNVVVPTAWVLTTALQDNTSYWWRARAFDGVQTYSPWVNARLFVNLFNDPPDAFNLSSPAPNAEVAQVQPVLSWANAVDKDGDAVTYTVTIYQDAALTQEVQKAMGLPAGNGGQTSWTPTQPLVNHGTYYWRVTAVDALGAQSLSIARLFVVNTGNTPPTAPVVLSPVLGGQSASASVPLTVQNSVDAEGDLITLVFELDTVNTFDSGDKKLSGQLVQNTGSSTTWLVTGLLENKHYFWRVKSQDGRAESAWVVADFTVNAVNDAPPAPTVKNPGNGAWSAILQPTLEANPVLDPEGDVVHYQFEVYSDAALANKVVEGTSSNPGWVVSVPLVDKTTHWWRVRAVDALGAASGWSGTAVLYVSTGPYQDPSIQVTSPSLPVAPTISGESKTISIGWEGTNPNIEPTIALYYASSTGSFNGTLIVDGLRQASGTQAGTYTWDVSQLAVGTYYIYGVIYDAKGVGRAWAPGAVVVPPLVQIGGMSANPPGYLFTTEDGMSAKFFLHLNSKPTATVTVPISASNAREGFTTPAVATFTPSNWNMDQLITVTGKQDCMRTGSSTYQVLLGKAMSLDPQYIGVSGLPVSVTNADSVYAPSLATNNTRFGICGLTLLSSRQVAATTWEYVVDGWAGNTGQAVNGVTVTLLGSPIPFQIIQGNLEFGALQTGEAGHSKNTLVLRATVPLQASFFQNGLAFQWTVTTK